MQEGIPCSVRRKTGCGIALMAKLSLWTTKADHPFSYCKDSTWVLSRPPIVFYAFDLLRLNGKDLQGLPIEERKAKLDALLKKPPGVIRYSVSFTKTSRSFLFGSANLGLEGLIGKRNLRGRQTNRSMVKIKLHKEQEFVVGGYTEPEGSRKHFGALFVGFYEGTNLKFAGRVGTGFSEKLLRSLFDDLQKIQLKDAFSPICRHLDATVRTKRLNRRRNEALPFGKTDDGLPSQIHGMDPG